MIRDVEEVYACVEGGGDDGLGHVGVVQGEEFGGAQGDVGDEEAGLAHAAVLDGGGGRGAARGGGGAGEGGRGAEGLQAAAAAASSPVTSSPGGWGGHRGQGRLLRGGAGGGGGGHRGGLLRGGGLSVPSSSVPHLAQVGVAPREEVNVLHGVH